MTILVDTLTEDKVLNQDDTQDTQDPGTQSPEGFTLPDKFKGKTAEEIAQSYVELERAQGSMANQLGEYRQMTDRFLSLEEKRVADLEKAGAEKNSIEIDATDLLADPEKVLEQYYDSRRAEDPEYKQLQERLERIEGQVGQSNLQKNHPDADTITNDPRFHEWVGAHPVRASLAQSAIQNRDVDQLDYLLTEWKERAPANSGDAQEATRQSEVRKAQAVATESSSASGTTSKGNSKRYSRRELVKLKMTNPDEYAANAEEILLAYAQKRVDD